MRPGEMVEDDERRRAACRLGMLLSLRRAPSGDSVRRTAVSHAVIDSLRYQTDRFRDVLNRGDLLVSTSWRRTARTDDRSELRASR